MVGNFKFVLLSLIFVSFNIIFAEEKEYLITQDNFEGLLQRAGYAHLNKEQMEQAYIDFKNNTRERNLAETRKREAFDKQYDVTTINIPGSSYRYKEVYDKLDGYIFKKETYLSRIRLHIETYNKAGEIIDKQESEITTAPFGIDELITLVKDRYQVDLEVFEDPMLSYDTIWGSVETNILVPGFPLIQDEERGPVYTVTIYYPSPSRFRTIRISAITGQILSDVQK
ncbi:hypothetical protein [Ignatzschineria sp. LJL83]